MGNEESNIRTTSIYRLTQNESIRSFRLLRNGRDKKVILTQTQVQCSEALVRLSLGCDPHNPLNEKADASHDCDAPNLPASAYPKS